MGFSSPVFPFCKALSVTSGKGGVGKTSIVANLALALTRLGRKVSILDGNLGLGNIDVLLGLTPKSTIEDFFNQTKKLWELPLQDLTGISVIPAASGVPELAALTRDQKLSLLTEVEVISKNSDIFLIDTAPGISSNVLFLNVIAHESIVIVTPEPTAIANTVTLLKTLSTKHGKVHFEILVNLANEENEARDVFKELILRMDRCLGHLSINYLGFVPFDKKMSLVSRRQELVLEAYPTTPSSKSISRLAETLLERLVQINDGYPFIL